MRELRNNSSDTSCKPGGRAVLLSPQRHLAALVRGRRGGRDAGVILIVILVCLSVTAAILSSFVLMAAAGRETLQSEQWQLQAQWLAESAFERTATQLLADPEYAGGSWTVAAKPTGMAENGMATIRVERVADQPLTRVVHVQADYPDDPIHRCRYAKQWTVALPKPPEPAKPEPEKPEPAKPETVKPDEMQKLEETAKPENTTKPAETTPSSSEPSNLSSKAETPIPTIPSHD